MWYHKRQFDHFKERFEENGFLPLACGSAMSCLLRHQVKCFKYIRNKPFFLYYTPKTYNTTKTKQWHIKYRAKLLYDNMTGQFYLAYNCPNVIFRFVLILKFSSVTPCCYLYPASSPVVLREPGWCWHRRHHHHHHDHHLNHWYRYQPLQFAVDIRGHPESLPFDA